MNETIETFERVEKKYLLTPAQYRALAPALAPRLREDQYGLHTINNIYYDTEHFDLIRGSLDKPVYKEKLRLRSYGTPRAGDIVFPEIKKKFKGIVYKRRAALPLRQASAFLKGEDIPAGGQVLREIRWMLDYYRPSPKVFLAYDRVALESTQGEDLRLTFDRNIRWRDTALSLRQGSWGDPLIADDLVLMEIKVPHALPLWLSQTLSELSIFPISFSKYGVCYQEHLLPGLCSGKAGLAHAS